MGGHAFSESFVDGGGNHYPALYCPRVPPAVYFAMLRILLEKLEPLFDHVAVPTEHPEKTSFGDIDALVCGPKDSLRFKRSMRELRWYIAEALGSRYHYVNRNGVGYYLLKVSKEVTDLAPVDDGQVPKGEQLGCNQEYWVQVDIELVDAPSQLEWRKFKTSHATLHNILKFGLRPAGFIFLNNGLHIKIPGEDRPFGPEAPKSPLIFLSNNVSQVLEFFQMSALVYGKEFETEKQYWRYATSAKHFSRERLTLGVDLDLKEESEAGDDSSLVHDVPEKVKSEKDREDRRDLLQRVCKGLDCEEKKWYSSIWNMLSTKEHGVDPEEKKSESEAAKSSLDGFRDYLATREAWTKFTDLWLPVHPQIGTTRPKVDDIFQGAMYFFGARERYYVQWNAYLGHRTDERFWSVVGEQLHNIKYTQLVTQEKVDAYTSQGKSLAESQELVIMDVGSEIFGRKNVEMLTSAKQFEKLSKWIHKKVNEAIKYLKMRVIFKASQGYAKTPVILDLPQADRTKHPKWLAESELGGRTEPELLDWIGLHGWPLWEDEKNRTLPDREAKTARDAYEKRVRAIAKDPIDKAILDKIRGRRAALIATFDKDLEELRCQEDELVSKQTHVHCWERKSPANSNCTATVVVVKEGCVEFQPE
ncbi:hypothetical protein FKW77_008388 [Venturia effusa]|uniref:Uncharacterized protein n=1 Tax=Venturia effusa TaxID=50376 RepID=A0A517L9S5_9PEZI|nr:hypothetical protein FKW77_008388 [Venturia effusa]